MIAEKFLWWLLPGFVLISGNFSPLRIGPILPIFWLLAIYVICKRRLLEKFFLKSGLSVVAMVAIIINAVVVAAYTTMSHQIAGNEFEGAIQPIAYSVMTLCRYILIVLVLIVLSSEEAMKYRNWWVALFVSYFLILVPLYIQVIIHVFFGYEVGYLFPTETGIRYGGFIGEPQTISAWLCCFFFCLIAGMGSDAKASTKIFLYASLIIALVLTQSTAWALASLLFILSRTKLWLFVLVMAGFVFFGLATQIAEKIAVEMFAISERSVTIAAGFELFTNAPINIFFGYGLGLTPYLIVGTDFFSEFPVFNLSHLGRQTIMNSYLEVVYELGMFGSFLYFFILLKASRITSIRQLLILIPILVGIFGDSGGFGAGYFLISIPILLNLSRVGGVSMQPNFVK